jgi:hypothetical protein
MTMRALHTTAIVRPGEYRIIRVDGTEQLIEEKPYMPRLYKAIGAECVDTVTLDRERTQIMIVDDTGMCDGKPVNSKATELYHAICKPGTLFSIHGDVAIVNDVDFA